MKSLRDEIPLCGEMEADFISHCERRGQYFTIHKVNHFTFGNAEYFTGKHKNSGFSAALLHSKQIMNPDR